MMLVKLSILAAAPVAAMQARRAGATSQQKQQQQQRRMSTAAPEEEAGAAADPFGFAQEKAMLGAKRAGQNSFTDVANSDFFGYGDEARTAAELAARSSEVDPLGVGSEEGQSLPVSYAKGIVEPRGKSIALPFLDRPAVLDDIDLAGDFGFDPFGLATDTELLLSYRDAELKHARLAMLAVVGWPLSELFHSDIATSLDLPSVTTKLAGTAPSVLNGGLGQIPVTFWVTTIAIAVTLELSGLQAVRSGKMPGDLGLRAGSQQAAALLGSKAKVADAELVNGRLAMLGIVGFALQEFATRLSGVPVPVIGETPFFFHPLF